MLFIPPNITKILNITRNIDECFSCIYLKSLNLLISSNFSCPKYRVSQRVKKISLPPSDDKLEARKMVVKMRERSWGVKCVSILGLCSFVTHCSQDNTVRMNFMTFQSNLRWLKCWKWVLYIRISGPSGDRNKTLTPSFVCILSGAPTFIFLNETSTHHLPLCQLSHLTIQLNEHKILDLNQF